MLDTLFGHGRDLDALQMSLRALVIFFVALVLVRIGGMRAFGRRSSFDSVILVGLGAVITRAIYGASPAIPIVAASAVLVVVHRLVAMLTARVPRLERVVKGRAVLLYHDGEVDARAMQRAGISHNDVDEAARADNIDDVREVRLETSGDLTVRGSTPP